MIVLIDLDGVEADWGYGYDVLAKYRKLHEEGGVPYAERPRWDLCEGLTERGVAINSWIMEQSGFYYTLPPIAGAIEATKRIIEAGHSVWFVSTPHPHNRTCASDKYDWVEEHFGFDYRRRTILTDDKTLVMGDVLIDDRPLIEGENPNPTWKHLCFGEYGYSSTTQSERAKTWDDVEIAIELLQWDRDLMATKAVG